MERHLETNIGQYALIINNKKFLMLRPADNSFWTLPGGRLDENEDYERSLKREVAEETQLHISNIEPFDIKTWKPPNKKHRYGIFFLCSTNTDTPIILSDEHTTHKWFSYEEAIEEEEIGKPGKEVFQKLRNKGLL